MALHLNDSMLHSFQESLYVSLNFGLDQFKADGVFCCYKSENEMAKKTRKPGKGGRGC